MPIAENLVGQKFARLTVIERLPYHITPNGTKQAMYKCVCDCGNTIATRGNALKTGNTKSCGCLKIEMLVERFTKHGGDKTTGKERLYDIWKSMQQRCRNDSNYAGRGISVCEEWKDYGVFREWAFANGYNQNAKHNECTIDRINNDGNYEPSNCRWVDMKVQSRNKRSNRVVTFNGESKTVTEWAEQIGISSDSLYNRLNKGWSVEEAITFPKLKSNRKFDRSSPLSKIVEIGGVEKTILDWCDVYSIDNDLVRVRVNMGWDIVDAITRKPRECARRKDNG